jgi:hypothetical protein
MNPATLTLMQTITSVASLLLSAWAHYRLNQSQPTPPATPPAPLPAPAPHLGDGHILAALLQALSARPTLPTPPASSPASSDLLTQWLALLSALQPAAPPPTPPTSKPLA